MPHEYTPPVYEQNAFHCPLCNVYADQVWTHLAQVRGGQVRFNETQACICAHCKEYSLWHGGVMTYPDLSGVQPPNSDLPEEIQADYEEAASILQKSPRGSSALLRLSIQKLCKELGEPGENINKDIATLVAKGLPVMIQQSLDSVRVIGNEAVHPGQIDFNDNADVARTLFKLVNIIAEKMISEPREVQEIYDSLPETKKQEIDRRDGV